MITPDIIATIIASGRPFEITPEGGVIVDAPDLRSRKARNQAAYRERKAATNGNEWQQTVTNGNNSAACDRIPSPSPSLPALPSDSPLPPPTHTPAPAGSRTCEADGLALAADLEPLPQKPAKNLPTSDQAKRIATMFKRRLSTPWQNREVSALRNLGTIEEADLAAVEAYYSANWPPDRDKNVLRHDLGTLLNNFRGEVDRARTWQRKSAPAAADATKRDFWAGSDLAKRTKPSTTPAP